MTTAAQYQQQLIADQAALARLEGMFTYCYDGSGTSPYHGGAIPADGSHFTGAHYAPDGLLLYDGVMSAAEWQAAVTAAQAAITLDTTMQAAAAYTENQLAQAAIFTAQQSAALQALSDVTANQYLPAYRGYVQNAPPGVSLQSFAPDQYDAATPSTGNIGYCLRTPPQFVPLVSGAEAHFMANYFAGVPVFFFMLGGTWRGLAQASGADCSKLVYSQTNATDLITQARAYIGAVAFDAAPMTGISTYIQSLCLSDASAANTIAQRQYAVLTAPDKTGSLFAQFVVAAAVIGGGMWAMSALSGAGAVSGATAASSTGAAGLTDTAALTGTTQTATVITTSGTTLTGSASMTDTLVNAALTGNTGAVTNAAIDLSGAGLSGSSVSLVDSAIQTALPLANAPIATMGGSAIDLTSVPTSSPVSPSITQTPALPTLQQAGQAVGLAQTAARLLGGTAKPQTTTAPAPAPSASSITGGMIALFAAALGGLYLAVH
jgi:hypothetical protein